MLNSVGITPTIEAAIWNDFITGQFTVADLTRKYFYSKVYIGEVIERRLELQAMGKKIEYENMRLYKNNLFDLLCSSEIAEEDHKRLKDEYKRVDLWLELHKHADHE